MTESETVDRDEDLAATGRVDLRLLKALDDARELLPTTTTTLVPIGADELGLELRAIRELRCCLARKEQDLVLAARRAGMSWPEIETRW